MKAKTGQRCCPKCHGTEFEMANCAMGAMQLGGYTAVCLTCDWHGYKIQLLPTPGVAKTNDVVRAINAEVAAAHSKPHAKAS